MATFSITLNLSDLRAALITAGNRDIRYYLNGALIEIGCSGKAWIVSTDGHRMSVIYAGVHQHNAEQCQVIVPRELIEKIKPIRGVDPVQVSFDGETVSMPMHAAHCLGEHFKVTGRTAPRDVRPSRGDTMHASDMLFRLDWRHVKHPTITRER